MFGWFDRKHLGWLRRFMDSAPVFPIPGHGDYLRQPLYAGDFCGVIEAFTMTYEAAVAPAYLAGMAIAFLLARLFVFKREDDAMHRQFVRFGLVNAIAFAQVWLVSFGLAQLVFPAIGFAQQGDTIAHGIGLASPVATSYVLHKRFSFRNARVGSDLSDPVQRR